MFLWVGGGGAHSELRVKGEAEDLSSQLTLYHVINKLKKFSVYVLDVDNTCTVWTSDSEKHLAYW